MATHVPDIADVRVNSSRLCISVRDPDGIDEMALRQWVRAVARPGKDSVHLILGPDAQAWAAGINSP